MPAIRPAAAGTPRSAWRTRALRSRGCRPPASPRGCAAARRAASLRSSRYGLQAASVVDHGADAAAGMHQLERLVDALERHRVRDVRIELDRTVHRLLDHARQLRAAAHAAERAAAP